MNDLVILVDENDKPLGAEKNQKPTRMQIYIGLFLFLYLTIRIKALLSFLENL